MVLYGASGHCRVVIEILEALNLSIDYIIDDNPELDDLFGYEVRRNTGKFDKGIITIGANWTRKKTVESIEVNEYITAIHPTAIVSPRAKFGEGTVVMQGAIIQCCAEIGNHCIINTGASVGHDAIIHDFVHIASRATITGGVEIGDGTWIGAGSVIRQGIKIGKNVMIGAGSVVVKDIPDNVTAFGNLCKVVHENEHKI